MMRQIGLTLSLCVFYTTLLILIVAAVRAQRGPTSDPDRLNFEYRIF